jgi:galactose mutarotase-like enzyme
MLGTNYCKEGGFMNVKIYEGKYKDQSCIVLENERLVLKVMPQFGSKLQSIFDKEKQKEYIYQSPWNEFKVSKYDESYGDFEFSGFDEMFPTVSECFYPSGPWKGIKAPDHGEVWSIPWDYEIQGNTLYMSVYGVRFPYRLEKRVELCGNSIQIQYKATNLSNFDFDFIWAAHPLFNCNENTVIVVPKSVKRIINTVPGKRLGIFGDVHNWPVTVTAEGSSYDISKISPKSSQLYEKYYVTGKMDEGWCALQDTVTGDTIGLSYPVDKVPYLGFWINEGGWADQYNAALEPCSGALDRLDTAVQWNQSAVVKAKSEYNWYLNLTFDTVNSEIHYIDEKGNIK